MKLCKSQKQIPELQNGIEKLEIENSVKMPGCKKKNRNSIANCYIQIKITLISECVKQIPKLRNSDSTDTYLINKTFDGIRGIPEFHEFPGIVKFQNLKYYGVCETCFNFFHKTKKGLS
jgi:hypothetical protein